MEKRNRHIMLIINPISGTGSKRGLTEFATNFLSKIGYDIDVVYTTGRGDATRLAKKAIEQNYHAVLAAGGDGTINETAAALCDSNVALGIIPAGSGNGLARHLNIPIDPIQSLNVIAENNIIDCDYCSVNERPFFCTFGVGFDATVSEKFAKQNKRGKFMYVKSAISEFLNYTPQEYTISANGKTFTEKAFIVACCNASQYGNNAYIAPRASITDGLIDVTIVHSGTPLDTAMVGVDLFTGYLDRNTLIHTFRTPSVVITRTNEGPAHLDGEPLIMPDTISIECHHKGLKIFIPQKDVPFRPIITPVNSMWNDFKIALSNIFRRR
ncbi:MAG: diacylglycerol kinase family lipid kinase [Muribaculaceae bacterium]|nr:diacylglycerol kinase family lipid kinase [Muribaculaceae bacterium]